MKSDVIVLNAKRDVSLTCYIQQVGGEFGNIPARPAVLILPGGGYDNCSDREAEIIAFPYLRAGYQAFVLRYSLKKNKTWPNPLEDYEQAMALIRSRAEEYCLYPDKIAVIGFSAGGHLAASAATMSRNRPNAAILVYAVLNGQSAAEWNPTAPDTVSAVDEQTPPCFLAASRTDSIVPVINTIQFTQALYEHDISFESHIYSYGPHGFSVADSTSNTPGAKISRRVKNWVDDSIDWLKEIFGDFGNGAMTEPEVGHYAMHGHGEYLSLDSTIGEIMATEEGRALMQRLLPQGSAGAQQETAGAGVSPAVIGRMRLSEALDFGGVPAEVRKMLAGQLEQIHRAG